jgi:hypothetical protein
MKTEKIYTYLGKNGIICSPVYLEGIYSTCAIRLIAGEGRKLTKDGKTFYSTVTIAEEDLPLWDEVIALDDFNS